MSVLANDKEQECPICGEPGAIVKRLDSRYLKMELCRYFACDIPTNVKVNDYCILRCGRCELEFASPRTPGSPEFYDWLSVQPGYYPYGRWEWSRVIDILRQEYSGKVTLLEVGCGDGLFLERVSREVPNVVVQGIDASACASERARNRLIDVFVGGVTEFVRCCTTSRAPYDVAVAFHCLEHVEDPKKLVTSLLDLVGENGRVFLSMPYSPMSLEVEWFDSLNHPPHHMTRWNVTSLEMLAKACKAKVQLSMPLAASTKERVLMSVAVAHGGRQAISTKASRYLLAIRHPLSVAAHLLKQAFRPRVKGRVAADVVLAEFQKCSI